MNDDERPNKIHAENRFYVELRQHKHDGNFVTMLSPDERTIWDMFPDFHKQLFTYYSNQEWEIVASLRRFSDNTVVGKVDGCPVTKADQAVISMQFYQSHRLHCRATLMLDELQQLLYPLREFSSDLLRQPIAEALYLHTTDPDIAAQRDSPGWQEYGVWLQPIPLAWLEKQESDYLRECANVWRSYLSPPAPPPASQEQKDLNNSKAPALLDACISAWNSDVRNNNINPTDAKALFIYASDRGVKGYEGLKVDFREKYSVRVIRWDWDSVYWKHFVTAFKGRPV